MSTAATDEVRQALIVEVPRTQHHAFKVLATEEGRSMSGIVRELIAGYVGERRRREAGVDTAPQG